MGEREREREKEKKRELKKKETKIIDKEIGDRPRTLATKRTRSEGEGGWRGGRLDQNRQRGRY